MAHILAVDDDPMVLALVSRMLVLCGHTVSEATGGREALSVLRDQTPDLILSDIRMEGLDGYALLREVRGQGIQIPVVGMSGHLPVADPRGCVFDAFLAKPFDMDDLNGAVAEALKGEPAMV